MINDFPPTAQDKVVSEQLTKAIDKELATYDRLMSEEVKAFNAAFKALELDYLVE